MATKEMVGSHADGDYMHSAEVKNLRHAASGCGVIGHTFSLTVTEANRVIAVPAFTCYVPNGSGGKVRVVYAGANVNVTASDGTNPRNDLLTIDSSGNVGMADGVATAETGLVANAPMATLDDDEILLAVVRSPAGQANVLAADIKGRAIDVSEAESQPRKEIFTASGTFTPEAGMGIAKVTSIGGGGGGGALGSAAFHATGGGGAGGMCIEWIDLTGASPVTVTIGAAGTSAANGGNTTFGAHHTASGGVGGSSSGALAGGAGGAASGGDINVPGSPGENGIHGGTDASYSGGNGGPSPYGSSGRGGSPGSGGAAQGYGAGGGGGSAGSNASSTGGAGGGGIIIVEWWS